MMSALVILRIWILNGRTRKMTIALGVVLTLYVCTSIALIGYILGGITCELDFAVQDGAAC